MECTYDNMMALFKEYFAFLPTIGDGKDPQIRKRFREFFAPGYVNRRGDPPIFLSGSEWTDFVCEGRVRWILSLPKDIPVGQMPWLYDPDPDKPQMPWYFAVDERKRMGFCLLTEQIVDVKTGEIYHEFNVNVHWGFTVHDNKVKFAWEFITRMPQLYEVDVLLGPGPHKASY